MEQIESILTSIKKMLGIDESYTHFDADLIMHINSVFATLTQLGAGPEKGFSINDEDVKWSEFITDETILGFVKSYMHLKVKLLFDPPLSSAVIESMNKMISEFEWRITTEVENKKITEENQNGE